MRLVECVPNFSEGRDESVLEAIAQAMRSVSGVSVLDIDPGQDTNRTVFTLVGPPESMVEAMFRAMKVAVERIDMTKHHGEHPRLGAVDVTPFVPVSGVTMEECVELAKTLGRRVGEELQVPVFLYEYAATRPERKSLSDIRQGEYEGLAAKLRDPEWKPDFGPAEFRPRSGAFVIGARKFLIAYNVNLNTKDASLAHEIALRLRERGRWARDERGRKVRGPDGKFQRVPGKLKATKAVGWYIEQYGQAQVSMNLTDFSVTPPHVALEAVREEAASLGLVVTGSELVGLIPKQAMIEAGKFYLKKQGASWGLPERELIRVAILSMGLSQITEFDPKKKIIEMRVEEDVDKLVNRTVADFVDECSMDSPAPGGGSVAALSASLGASLASMVANLTVGKKRYRDVWDEMRSVAARAQTFKERFVQAVDADTAAFNEVMAAFKLPKATDEQKAERKAAIEEATKKAVEVPLGVLRDIPEALELAATVAKKGNVNSVTDAGVAAVSLRSAAQGAYLNVKINLQGLSDQDYVERIDEQAQRLLERVEKRADEIAALVRERMGS